jgi:alanine racemase
MHDGHSAGATLRIDLDALASNYRLISGQAGKADVAAVVKANGYGLGADVIVDTLSAEGCRHFFVAHLQEAEALLPNLRAGSTVYVLNGLLPGAERLCAAINVIPVLNSLDQVSRWAATAKEQNRVLPAALQFDTGMSRLGLPPIEIETLIAHPKKLDGIDIRLLMSHFACADTQDAPSNLAQIAAFEAATAHFPGIARSLDNSAGVFGPHSQHYDLVRAGIALYGAAPTASLNPMKPVVSLDARIIQLREVSAGTGVGYGLTFRADRPTFIATVSIGYADGWPRHLSNRGFAFIGGIRVPIIGRVSMDSITLDVTNVPDYLLYPGASVQLLGPLQTIDDVARDAGTIAYEILTQLGGRFTREYSPVRHTALEVDAAA